MSATMNFPIPPSEPPGNSSNGNDSEQAGPSLLMSPLGELSKARRDALKCNEEPLFTLFNQCPISKYYSTADKVLEQFKAHFDAADYDSAFIFGRRFALFSTASLPKHDYYSSSNADLVRRRLKNQKDVLWVTECLENIVRIMDQQEWEKQKAESQKIQERIAEEKRQLLDWENEMKARLMMIHSSRLGELDSNDNASDMHAKLERLNILYPKGGEKKDRVSHNNVKIDACKNEELSSLTPIPPPFKTEMKAQDLAILYSTSAMNQLKSNGVTAMFPKPPSYSDLFLDNQPDALTCSNNTTALMPYISSPISALKPRIPVRSLFHQYSNQFESLRSSKRIDMIKLGTYQGRLSASPRYDSTNGCTVISPLVVASHIYPQHEQQRNTITQMTKKSYYGITNTEINDIIDKRAPLILQIVREKLGLNRHALIVPSDVHDYLVDENILPQEKFVGVCGGNILYEEHWKALVRMISDTHTGDVRQKVGAALFFCEHVISIIKIQLGNGAYYIDLIDSLPHSETGGMASRIRCKDQATFETVLQWYACSRFNDSHCDYIDASDWNDDMCDFDPRVFQGFVWAE